MSYSRAHYNEVLKAVQERFNIPNDGLPPEIWIAWRAAIKRLFDKNILIKEIIQAIPEAGEPKKWPNGTAFWRRVEDVVLKNRREAERGTVRITGMEGMNDLIRKRQTQ